MIPHEIGKLPVNYIYFLTLFELIRTLLKFLKWYALHPKIMSPLKCINYNAIRLAREMEGISYEPIVRIDIGQIV